MAPAPFRAAVAALRQRAVGPVASRATGPRMERTLSTGKRLRRGPNEVCRYNPKESEDVIEELRKSAKAANDEREVLIKAIKNLEAKQTKPWFSSTIKGRLLDWPGLIALTLAAGELLSKIWR